MTAPVLALPADTRAKLHIRHDPTHNTPLFMVAVARPPAEPVPENLVRPGELSALLTHDPGVSWPDRSGEELSLAVLERGGLVVLAFSALADAMACHRRLTGSRGHA